MSEHGTETLLTSAPVEARRTLRDALDHSVKVRGDRPALAYFGQEFTFDQVRNYAQSFGSWLQDQGIGFGDRVIVQLQNVPQFMFAAAGCWEIGAIIVPVSPMYRAAEVSRIAKDSGARVWVTAPKVWYQQGVDSVEGSAIEHVVVTEMDDFGLPEAGLPSNKEAADGPLPTVVPVTTLNYIFETYDGTAPNRPELHPTDDAVFTYTSGTTGPPKAATTSHGNLVFVGHSYAACNGLDTADEVIFAMAPLVHITGLSMHIGSWFTTSCKVVLAYRFHPEITLEQMVEHGVTWTTGTATAYQAMLHVEDEPSKHVTTLKFVGSGGSSVPVSVTQAFFERFNTPLLPGYGLTETTAAVTQTRAGQQPRIDEATGVVSVGPAMAGIQVKIVDASGQSLAAHQQGEVLIAGPGVVRGYWQRQEENTFLADGWVRTGDVGFLDDEDWLYIVDRTKNLIVASGYKVWPREVEEVLHNHPAVNEVAVVGAPDDYRGETVVAFLSLEPGSTVTEQELIDHCRGEIAAYKVPSRIIFKSELPKNFNGKIQVRELKAEMTPELPA